MIGDIIKRIEAMGVLPDAWLVTLSPEFVVDGVPLEPITAGDLRDLVRVVTAIYASWNQGPLDEHTQQSAVSDARALIDLIDDAPERAAIARRKIAEAAYDAGYGAGLDHELDADGHPTRDEYLRSVK